MASNGNDVVTAIRGWVVDGFVFAHEMHCNCGGDAAEGTAVCADVNVVPCSGVGETCLYRVSCCVRFQWP
jgi:hypothetical protein